MQRSLRIVSIASLAAVAVAGVAHAGGTVAPPGWQPKDRAAERRIALENRAVALINQADRHVRGVDAGCRPAPFAPRSTPTHDAPSQAVLDVLAPLRRPATPAEANAYDPHEGGFGGEIYVDYERHVTSADGHQFTIVVGRSDPNRFRIPARCLGAQRAWLVHLLKGQPARLRSVTLREFDRARRLIVKPTRPNTPVDGIYLFGESGGGGGGDVKSFLDRGLFTSHGGGDQGGSRVDGLVPDGVASVTFTYPRTISRGPNYKPAVFPRAFTTTVAVHDDVVSFHVPRSAGDGLPRHMVWRDAAGAVTHTFTEKRS